MDAEALHNKKFHVYIPEYYVTKIPKYFMEPCKPRPPMVNGVPVTVAEYQLVDPTYEPDEEFIPEPIYSPMEGNLTFSTKSVAEIYDAYDSNVNVVFKNPHNVPEMIDIINKYIGAARMYAIGDYNLKEWCERLASFSHVLKDTYDSYIRRMSMKNPDKYPHVRVCSISQFLSLFKGS
jgi:hypothetical protein